MKEILQTGIEPVTNWLQLCMNIYSQSLYQLSYNRDCTIRESNPGRVDGNDPWYHYTNGAARWEKKEKKW